MLLWAAISFAVAFPLFRWLEHRRALRRVRAKSLEIVRQQEAQFRKAAATLAPFRATP